MHARAVRNFLVGSMLTAATLGTGGCGPRKPAAHGPVAAEALGSRNDPVAVEALGLLNEGRQRDAEALLQTTLARDPEVGPVLPLLRRAPEQAEGTVRAIGVARLQGKQRVVFLAAACLRSRFEIDDAAPRSDWSNSSIRRPPKVNVRPVF